MSPPPSSAFAGSRKLAVYLNRAPGKFVDLPSKFKSTSVAFLSESTRTETWRAYPVLLDATDTVIGIVHVPGEKGPEDLMARDDLSLLDATLDTITSRLDIVRAIDAIDQMSGKLDLKKWRMGLLTGDKKTKHERLCSELQEVASTFAQDSVKHLKEMEDVHQKEPASCPCLSCSATTFAERCKLNIDFVHYRTGKTDKEWSEWSQSKDTQLEEIERLESEKGSDTSIKDQSEDKSTDTS